MVLAGLGMVVLNTGSDELATTNPEGFRDTCRVAMGQAYSPRGDERAFIAVATYQPQDVFVEAFADPLGSLPDTIDVTYVWRSVFIGGRKEPIEIEAETHRSVGPGKVEMNINLFATSPDGTDALNADTSPEIFRIAQDILETNPERFGCSEIETFPHSPRRRETVVTH